MYFEICLGWAKAQEQIMIRSGVSVSRPDEAACRASVVPFGMVAGVRENEAGSYTDMP